MQAVILAAGKGSRLLPLTQKLPKPLIKVAGLSLIERVLSSLPDNITEIIIVVGYKANLIKKYLGKDWHGKKIIYVYQSEQRGTFSALNAASSILKNKFLVLAADVIYKKKDLEKLALQPLSILVRKEKALNKPLARCVIKRGLLYKLEEKVIAKGEVFVNCAAYCLDKRIFKELVFYGSNGEEWLSSMVGTLASHSPVFAVLATCHFTITNTEDIDLCKRYLSTRQ